MKTPVTQRSPCYSAVSALLMNPLPDRSNYSPLCHTHYLTPDLVSSGQTLYQVVSWRLILQSSMLQRFTANSRRELSALKLLNNKQRKVSMFLMFLFKLLTQLPFSILSLLPPIPSFSFDIFSVFLIQRLKISLHSVSPMANFFAFCFTP